MKSEMSEYLKEIKNTGWVQEIIMERFDNALELMTPSSIIYGGAIRDCLAGKDLLGDLDLAIPAEDFGCISETFHTNPKWIPLSSHVKEQPVSSDKEQKEQFVIKSSGDLSKLLAPMSGVSSFVTMGGKIVQLITSKYQDRDPLQSAIYVARMVDIVCCGMIMLCDGRIFEAVPGAYQDCLDGVLRINKDSDTIYLDAIEARVKKLTDRGWKNTIDVDKVIKEMEENREKIKRKEKRLAEARSKRNNTSPLDGLKEHKFLYGGLEEISSGYMQEITKRQVENYFSGPVECVRLLRMFAEKEHINLRVKQTPIGSIYFETVNGVQAYKIQRRLQKHYEKNPIKSSRFAQPIKKKTLEEAAELVNSLSTVRTLKSPSIEVSAPSTASWGTIGSGGSTADQTYTISGGSSGSGYFTTTSTISYR